MGKRALDYVPVTDRTPEPIATPAPTADDPPLSSATAELVDERKKLEMAAEELFAKLADKNVLTAGERQLLKSVAPSSVHNHLSFERWLAKGASRVSAIRECQAVAGSVADRAAASQGLADAIQKQATEAPAIEKQIAELQARLTALGDSVRHCETDVQRRERAVETLTTERLLPDFVREALIVLRQTTREERAEFLRCQNRLAAISDIMRMDPDKPEELDRIGSWLGPVVSPLTGGSLFETIFPYAEPPRPFGPNPRRFVPRRVGKISATVSRRSGTSPAAACRAWRR
jgi:hypothetical protein